MLIGNDFLRLRHKNEDLGYFVQQYEQTPEQFMSECKPDFKCDLKDKIVISVEFFWDSSDDKYALNIKGIYKSLESQRATLSYHGHISFITIERFDLYDKPVIADILSKDDECFPQSFEDWYETSEDCHGMSSEGWTKDKIIKYLESALIFTTQDPDFKLNTDNLIILEGL